MAEELANFPAEGTTPGRLPAPNGREHGRKPRAPGARAKGTLRKGRAATDDANGNSAGGDAHSAAAIAEREAYAGAAGPESETAPRGSEVVRTKRRRLPRSGAAFAELVHQTVDLVKATAGLVECEDPKIRERVLAMVLGFKYEKANRGTESPANSTTLTWDLPRPTRE